VNLIVDIAPLFLGIESEKVGFFIFVHLMQKGGLNGNEEKSPVCEFVLHDVVPHGS
jgi:hypothetical protein